LFSLQISNFKVVKMEGYLDYMQMVSKAMYCVVKEALNTVAKHGIQGNHHFFITFCTSHKDVQISDELRKKYPEELTIVIEHQFYNLKVFEDKFEVRLSFDEVLEDLVVPFASINRFADPGVPFHLCFQYEGLEEDGISGINKLLNFNLFQNSEYGFDKNMDNLEIDEPGKIISLSEFRKKKENNEKT
jgi:uncharacterized protein